VVGLVSLRNIASVSRSAVTRQIAALDESRAFALIGSPSGRLAGRRRRHRPVGLHRLQI